MPVGEVNPELLALAEAHVDKLMAEFTGPPAGTEVATCSRALDTMDGELATLTPLPVESPVLGSPTVGDRRGRAEARAVGEGERPQAGLGQLFGRVTNPRPLVIVCVTRPTRGLDRSEACCDHLGRSLDRKQQASGRVPMKGAHALAVSVERSLRDPRISRA